MAGCLAKLFWLALVLAQGYQVVYNWQAAQELGGKYTTFDYLVYQVGSIVPAFLLTVHIFRVVCEEDPREKAKRVSDNQCLYRLVALAYFFGVGGSMLLWRVYIHFQYRNQLGPERITSYEKVQCFQLWYWWGIQFALAIFTSFAFLTNFADDVEESSDESVEPEASSLMKEHTTATGTNVCVNSMA